MFLFSTAGKGGSRRQTPPLAATRSESKIDSIVTGVRGAQCSQDLWGHLKGTGVGEWHFSVYERNLGTYTLPMSCGDNLLPILHTHLDS